MTEVVVTGLGVVGPWGAGSAATREALERGSIPRSSVDRSAGFHRRGGATLAGLCREADLAGLLPPAQARRMSQPSKLAVAATTLALREAGLQAGGDEFATTGVTVSTAFGPSSFTERLLHAIFHLGPDQASPAVFTESVASAAASQVALSTRALGPNLTVTQRESGALQAIGDAAAWVRRGRAERMLAGSVEEMTPLLHAVLDRFGALATGDEIRRPFDGERNGLFACEGAAMVVLESAAGAVARGATIRARVRAFVAAFDPTASPIDWGSGGAELAHQLRSELDRLGVPLNSIDLVVSGANGARRGDALEAACLNTLFGALAPPPIVAPKGVLGEYGGGLIAAALLSLDGAFARACPSPRRILVSSLAAGGSAAWLVLDRP